MDRVGCRLDLGIQTNGLLVTPEIVQVLQRFGVRAGVSIDGPKAVNDLHRVDRRGRGSFDRVVKGISALRNPISGDSVFGGVLSVANPNISPRDTLNFFSDLGTPSVDFLLPDFNYDTIPESLASGRIGDWLVELFEIWYSGYPDLDIRIFHTIMKLFLGGTYGYDAFGSRGRGVVIVESDGSYEGLDVLKTSYEGAGKTGLSVSNTPIDALEDLPIVRALSEKASSASAECIRCEFFGACGGGYLPHRYSSKHKFDAPSVYCSDLKLLFRTIRSTVGNDGENLSRADKCEGYG